MKISDVVNVKGTTVVTISPQETVATLLDLLSRHNIGAVVVSNDGAHITGIVSERDVVRHLHADGAGVLDTPVQTIMTSEVYTCVPDDDVAEIAANMTEHRTRHLPVIVDGNLAAIVSIGDIVKSRISQLQQEREHLEAYINQ